MRVPGSDLSGRYHLVEGRPYKPHATCADGCVYTKEGSPDTDQYCMVNNNMDDGVFQCEDFPTTPSDWVRPVLLESGYSAHFLSGLGLGPIHLQTGVSPKQIADTTSGGVNHLYYHVLRDLYFLFHR